MTVTKTEVEQACMDLDLLIECKLDLYYLRGDDPRLIFKDKRPGSIFMRSYHHYKWLVNVSQGLSVTSTLSDYPSREVSRGARAAAKGWLLKFDSQYPSLSREILRYYFGG